MRRLALFLGAALSLLTTSAVAQNCDGFTDVLASSPFCPDVTWLAKYGITKGCGGSQFCHNQSVTRLEMAAFMHRLGENPAFVNGGNAFGATAVLGTTDNNSFAVLVDGQRAMLVQPAVDSISFGFNPNIVNGPGVNSVAGGVVAATIAGGGGCNPGTGGTCSSAAGNQVTGSFGTVGGGAENVAANFATVAGGSDNIASGSGGTVAGGDVNLASDELSTVAGGERNEATGAFSTIGGGQNNFASGSISTVAGGANNTATGNSSTVAGGAGNTASGISSFIAGSNANADQSQCFVFANWSSQPGSNFSCLGTTNIARFGLDHGLAVDYGAATMNGSGTRYVYFGDIDPGNTITAWNNASLTDGGTWTNASDHALKADFATVDAQAVLAKVAQLPIDEWRYKTETGQRHLGPVAQDFYAAFGLGADDKHITTVDEGGVAPAAIKGLNAKVEEQATLLQSRLESAVQRIQAQQREIAELTDRVQKAETMAADVVALKAALVELQRGRETVAVK